MEAETGTKNMEVNGLSNTQLIQTQISHTVTNLEITTYLELRHSLQTYFTDMTMCVHDDVLENLHFYQSATNTVFRPSIVQA